MSKMSFGRKRSCWKKNYNSDGGNPIKNASESGVITCAICGIKRHYKFIKQTRKFGLHSCEPCRKFISSMILYVKNREHVLLKCAKKGAENCVISETVPKNGTPRSKKDALSNLRCKACWLLLCLKKYEMPLGLKKSLAQFLTEDFRPSDLINSDGCELDFKNISKRRSHQSYREDPVKSCMQVLSENYIKSVGIDESEDSKKIVILRIKC